MNIKMKLFDSMYMPVMAHGGDACYDCKARCDNPISIKSHSRCLVNLGFCLGLETYTEAVIRPRSGLSKRGIDVAIGTIDSGYTGEVKANIINNSDEDFIVNNGDRICQIAIRKYESVLIEKVDLLESTERGDDGFGSSGIN